MKHNSQNTKVGDTVRAYHQKDRCVIEGTITEILSEYAFVMQPKDDLNKKIAFLFEDIR